jgi:hypothetical protein
VTAYVFDPREHAYTDGNRRIPSVTEIQRAVGMAEDGPWFRDPTYRARGRAVHYATRLISRGEFDESTTHPVICGYAAGFPQFLKDTGFVCCAWEVSLAHPKMGYAGTIDLLGYAEHFARDYYIVDVKTGSVPAGVGFQLAGYEPLATEGVLIENPDSDNAAWVEQIRAENPRWKKRCLNLREDGSYTFVSKAHGVSLDSPAWPGRWRAGLTLYHAREELGLL